MSLADPAAVMRRLEAIETDLACRQNALEEAAQAHFVAKREKEKRRAEVFMSCDGTVAERSARADEQTAEMGNTAEAEYEAQKAVVKVLDTRAAIGMSILRAQSRASA